MTRTPPKPAPKLWEPYTGTKPDFADIRGQEACKRAVTIAMAGRHTIALVGPSGWGKSMLLDAASVAMQSRIKGVEGRDIAGVLESGGQAMDIHCEVPAVPYRELTAMRRGTDSAYAMLIVQRAWKFGGLEDGSDIPARSLGLGETCLMLLKQAVDELGLNARSVGIVCRVARTIANMRESEFIGEMDLAEAIQYRLFDRKF